MAAFVDANIPIFASGTSHPLKAPCQAIIIALLTRPGTGVSSAEVLQELLHVYLRRGETARARTTVVEFDEVLDARLEPITREDVLRAATGSFPARLQARDRLHLAVMERLGISDIISTDTGFDGVPGFRRLDPMTFASWREEVFGTVA